VEDGETAQLAAQMMARIGAEGEERVGHRLEEDLIETRLVRKDEWARRSESRPIAARKVDHLRA
jgi:hypothetical protein